MCAHPAFGIGATNSVPAQQTVPKQNLVVLMGIIATAFTVSVAMCSRHAIVVDTRRLAVECQLCQRGLGWGDEGAGVTGACQGLAKGVACGR